MRTGKTMINRDKLITIIFAGTSSLVTFLVVSYFNGFITKADYRPEMFVTKDEYNADKLGTSSAMSELKTEMINVKNDLKDIKTDIKELLKRK